MVIDTSDVTIAVAGAPMRCVVTAPRTGGPYPGILLYSDIFQLTPSTLRCAARLAGYGFVVLAPEIWHRVERPGAAIAFDDAGRTRGSDDAKKTAVAEIDADCRAALESLAALPNVDAARIGVAGFCIGGHLAFRAALQPEVRAAACFYPTGLHNGELGQDEDAKTLARCGELGGALLIVFGSNDPHVPAEGRAAIDAALRAAGTHYTISLYDAEHAFMRDEGPRYDPELTDKAWAQAIAFFRQVLSSA